MLLLKWPLCPSESTPQPGDEVARTLEEPPCLKRKDEMPFKKSLKGNRREAFAKDSDLVRRAQEDYFRANCPHFAHETSHDLAEPLLG